MNLSTVNVVIAYGCVRCDVTIFLVYYENSIDPTKEMFYLCCKQKQTIRMYCRLKDQHKFKLQLNILFSV